MINIYGSGGISINKWLNRWGKTSEKRTSRSVFSAFCDALISNEDKNSGGAPQLVGIYRKGFGETFGVIYNKKQYIIGLPSETLESFDELEWRNCLFERCDWETMKPLKGAQRHSRPRGLGRDID